MKVLQVLPALNSGGVERGTLEIADALVKAGHDSFVMSAGGRLCSQLEREGSVHINRDVGKKSPLTFAKVWSLRRYFAEQQFDIVHARSRMPAWLCHLAIRGMPRRNRPRFVTTVHGMHSVSRYSKVMNYGERVIVVSESVKRFQLENYPDTDTSKLRLIYRGIDPDVFSPYFQASEEWQQQWYGDFPQTYDKCVITLPGRITRLKGHLRFLHLVKSLLDNKRDVIGLIVGGLNPKKSTYAKELFEIISEQGLDRRVLFVGHRSDMREIYSISDVVLSLSEKPESFGRTVLEPLAMGVPVVAWHQGGVGEILDRLFPAGAVAQDDEQGLVDAVERALRGEAAPMLSDNPFLLSRMCEQTLAVYQELLDERQAQEG